MSDVHYLTRPPIVHLLKDRKGSEYTTKCGEVHESMEFITGSSQRITCDDCCGIVRGSE